MSNGIVYFDSPEAAQRVTMTGWALVSDAK